MPRGIRRIGLEISLGLLCGACTTTLATFSIKPTAIDQVKTGDTMTQVTRALGQPKETLGPEHTSHGQARVIWIYAATTQATTSLSGRLQPTPAQPFSLDLQRQLEQMDRPSYLIVFADGMVSDIVYQP